MVREHLSAQISGKVGEHRQRPTEPLFGCLELCLSEPVTTFPANPASIFPTNDYFMKIVMLSMIALGDIPFWELDRDPRQVQAWSALSHLFETEYDDTILALVSLAISRKFSESNLQTEGMKILVQSACSGKDTIAILIEGIRCGFTAILRNQHQKQCPPYNYALPIFVEILKRLGELPSKEALTEPQSGALLLDVARLILAVNSTDDRLLSQGAATAQSEFMVGALGFLRTCSPPAKQGDFTASLFDAALVAFIRSSTTSTSTPEMQTLDWLNLCLNENDFVADQTISNLIWGLKTIESREETLQLIYTYMSKWFSEVEQTRYKQWISGGLIHQLLEALPGGTTTGEMNLRIPLTLRHVIKRATKCAWEVHGSDEIMRVGLNVVNSINTEKGTVGQAYSLLIFEVLLDIWQTIPEDKRAKQMSERMDLATMRMLMETEALLDNQPLAAPSNQPSASSANQPPASPVNQLPATTQKQPPANSLTAAIGPKIAVMVSFEPFNLSPVVLRKFLSELRGKNAEAQTSSAPP
ncbi:hypothetical protein FRC01_006389 [Tulasnella sp. 417]|nr:hypothetical protein FRC01_006389 [Tulasnella sp. 417]